jgi:alpha-amylase
MIGDPIPGRPDAPAPQLVANHDTARSQFGGEVLTWEDGSLFNLAQVFTLAYPYGNPVLTSEYRFGDIDQGPPSDGDGGTVGAYVTGDTTVPSGCTFADPWVCEHRWGNIASMIGFRANTIDAWHIDNVWTNGYQQIAFGRGDLGFVAINRESFAMDRALATGMEPGLYCDVLSGEFDLATRTCDGDTVTVAADGTVPVSVGPLEALAIHTGSRLDG